MNIEQAVFARYTCKAYDPSRQIPDDQVRQIETLLRNSPSSINSQPWHFLMSSSAEIKQRIAKDMTGNYAANAAKVKNASHVVVFCARTSLDDAYMSNLLEQEQRDGRYPAPEAREAQARSRAFYTGLHRYDMKDTQHWMEKQVYLSLGFLLMGAAVMGIDATPIEGFDQRLLNAEFDLRAKGLTSVVIAALGYRSADDFNAKLPKSRLPKESVLTTL